VYPKGESKKFNIATYNGRVKRKKITGRKNKTNPHYGGYQSILKLFSLP
jgi:hypothetical protein